MRKNVRRVRSRRRTTYNLTHRVNLRLTSAAASATHDFYRWWSREKTGTLIAVEAVMWPALGLMAGLSLALFLFRLGI